MYIFKENNSIEIKLFLWKLGIDPREIIFQNFRISFVQIPVMFLKKVNVEV